MAILEQEIRSTDNMISAGLRRHRISSEEYEALTVAGIFDGQRIELIEGDIIDMAPIGDEHAAMTDPLRDLLVVAFGPGFTIRTQAPILVGRGRSPSVPQPDLTVVTGSWRDYSKRKPEPDDIRLIVELADSSLKTDRSSKSILYAFAGIPEYWIVNLVDGNLEVYRQPVDGVYTSVVTFHAKDQVTPLFATGSLSVGDFLP